MQLSSSELNKLIAKYGGAVPRYTSYPTAPEWQDIYDDGLFEQAIARSNVALGPISLYLHIPFCESQCYYCACNVVISPQHGIEDRYISRLCEEIDYIATQIDSRRKVSQLAFGGGTPTYLSPQQIEELMQYIRDRFNLVQGEEQEYSIEIDPRVTSVEHLRSIQRAGFNRLSMGVQDFNPETQAAINRIQSYDMLETLVQEARAIGFTSINFDLIYGLPYQSLESFAKTIDQVLKIRPERIALFNYAHIPSVFPFQRKYISEDSLPNAELRMAIFDTALERFCGAAYESIGLDHFALAGDPLAIAQKNSSLYRNFQGYTTHAGCDLFGMGLTAISDVAGVYKQNHKKLNDYYRDFGADKFKLCSADDIERRHMIREIMCKGYLEFSYKRFQTEFHRLELFLEDAALELERDSDLVKLRLTALGRSLVRNIASVFDSYLTKASAHKVFSKSI